MSIDCLGKDLRSIFVNSSIMSLDCPIDEETRVFSLIGDIWLTWDQTWTEVVG